MSKLTCNVFAPNAPPPVARLFQRQYLTFPKTSSYSLQFPLNNYEKRRSKRFTCCERALFQSNCSSTRTRCIFVAHTVLVFHALLHLWNLPWKKSFLLSWTRGCWEKRFAESVPAWAEFFMQATVKVVFCNRQLAEALRVDCVNGF